MPLPDRYASPMSLLSKLRRLKSALNEEVSWEAFVEFAVTAYHLIEWIKQDVTASESAIIELNTFRDSLVMQACRDIANTHKHKKIERYTPKIKDMNVEDGWGRGRFGAGGFGVGEEEIAITMEDGTTYDGLDLAVAVLAGWEQFFERYPTLLQRIN